MTTSDVTLIIPTTGDILALKRLLDSAIAVGAHQKPWLKFTIANNAQSESAASEVSVALKAYSFVEQIREQERGKAYAINKAIAHAKTEFVAFMDDDTVFLLGTHLDTMRQIFNAHPNVAYVSGKVMAVNDDNASASLWEKKGGLSKGEAPKYWSREFLSSREFHYKAWQFNKMCAGANSMIRREVLTQIGPFHILLEGHSGFQAGATIEVGYRIARAGYELYYEPSALVGHFHPENPQTIRHKLFSYGQADTAYQMSNFLSFGDIRCLTWSVLGHAWYTISKKLIPSMFGRYPLSPIQVLYGLGGNIVGPLKYLYVYYLRGGKNDLERYRATWSKHG